MPLLLITLAALIAVLALFRLAAAGPEAFRTFFRWAGYALIAGVIIMLALSGRLVGSLLVLGVCLAIFFARRARERKGDLVVTVTRVDEETVPEKPETDADTPPRP